MTKNNVLLLFLLGALTLGMWFCTPKSTPITEQKFLNLHDSVGHVGMKMCRSCHPNVYDTYIHTGMGQSFGKADLVKTAAEFNDSSLVYDAELDFYYRPFFRDSVFYILEFRLEDGDTVHQRLERVDYIIGSGHHTNSHMLNRNGYVYQAPITYYTQEKRWDLAPGFEGGNNKRFSRAILSECLTCHNHTPTPAFGAANKYHEMPLGIECERCHGAGALHVREKLMGKRVDTSKYIDYSIVNPRHLSIDRQMDLCQRCHLQGVAVLNEGKSFYDFKPGMALSEVMNVFLPRFTNSDKRFIMASQADRLRKSDCFVVSQQLSCITCHNPHHDVHSTLENNYNTACQNCHKAGSEKSKLFDCSASADSRALVGDDCVQCHMPPSGSIDIPHVNITDHYISKTNIKLPKGDSLSTERVEEIAGFLGLQSLVVKQPSPLEMARGYLALWDKFMGEPAILDSANYYLQRSKANAKEKFSTLAHYYFNKKDYQLLRSIAPPAKDIQDAWSAYRVGEAAKRGKDLQAALPYFKRATELQAYNLEFQEKYGSVQAQLGQLKDAEKTFRFILREQPQRKVALANLGLVLAQKGQITAALQHYERALQLDPDYRAALLNKVGLLVQLKRQAEAQGAIRQLLKKHPNTKGLLQQQGIL